MHSDKAPEPRIRDNQSPGTANKPMGNEGKTEGVQNEAERKPQERGSKPVVEVIEGNPF